MIKLEINKTYNSANLYLYTSKMLSSINPHYIANKRYCDIIDILNVIFDDKIKKDKKFVLIDIKVTKEVKDKIDKLIAIYKLKNA